MTPQEQLDLYMAGWQDGIAAVTPQQQGNHDYMKGYKAGLVASKQAWEEAAQLYGIELMHLQG